MSDQTFTPVPDGTLHNIADTGVLPNVPGHPPTDDVKSIARELRVARDRITELEDQSRRQIRGVQLSWALDLWMALGCPVSEFDGYVQRNQIAETWVNLLGVVRGMFRPVCGKPTDGGPCVLSDHGTGPCYSRGDVGVPESIPHAVPVAEAPAVEPHAYIAVKRYRSPNVTEPEWLQGATVVPASDPDGMREELTRRGYEFLPIVGTETGTRPAAPARCQTTTIAVWVGGDGRSVWCDLPDGHMGKHHATFPQPGNEDAIVHWGNPPTERIGYAVGYCLDGDFVSLGGDRLYAAPADAAVELAAVQAEAPATPFRVYELREVRGE